MTEPVLLDARTINAVLKVLGDFNNLPWPATDSIVKLALDNGLKLMPVEDQDLSGGPVSPFMSRSALQARAIRAASDFYDWCSMNETQFTGWGDGDVPAGAERWRKQSALAVRLIADDPKDIELVERLIVAVAPPAPVVPDGWKTIDTAPKDGTVVLGSHAQSCITVWWSPDADEGRGGWTDGCTNRYDEEFTYPITHWMPTPPLPVTPLPPGYAEQHNRR